MRSEPFSDVIRVTTVSTTLTPSEPTTQVTVVELRIQGVGAEIESGRTTWHRRPDVYLAKGASWQRFSAIGATSDTRSDIISRIVVAVVVIA